MKNFTSKCKHYNRNLKKWFGKNMLINCGCTGGDIRGNLQYTHIIANELQHSLQLPNGIYSNNVILKRLDGLSVYDTISLKVESSINLKTI